MNSSSANVDQLQVDLEKRALLRRPRVEAVTGLSTSSLYDAIRDGRFPAPVRIFPNTPNKSVAWLATEVLEWLDSRRHA